MHLKKDSKQTLLYSSVYIGLSTILFYSMYPDDPFAFDGLYNNAIYWILSLIAIPGQLLSWGIRFGGTDSETTEYLLVGISQIVNLLIWWRLILIVKRK